MIKYRYKLSRGEIFGSTSFLRKAKKAKTSEKFQVKVDECFESVIEKKFNKQQQHRIIQHIYEILEAIKRHKQDPESGRMYAFEDWKD